MIPLPREDATPPVTKMCLVNGRPPCAIRATQPREPTLPLTGRAAHRADGRGHPALGSLRAAMVAVTTSADGADARHRAPDRPRRPRRRSRWCCGSRPTWRERHLTFDDGVYGASAVAMRAGGQPFRDVFSSQGPLFLPARLGRRPARAPHDQRPAAARRCCAGAACSSASTYVAGRADHRPRRRRCSPAGLVSVTGDVPLDHRTDRGRRRRPGLRHAHDRPASLRWRDDVTVRRAVWLGLGVGATISVKALLAPVILPVALVLAGQPAARARSWPGAATRDRLPPRSCGCRGARQRVGRSPTSYHLEVAGDRTPGANLAQGAQHAGRPRPAIVLVAGRPGDRRRRCSARRALPPRAASARLTSPDTLLLAWLAGTRRRAPRRAPDVAPPRVPAHPRPGAARRPPSAVDRACWRSCCVVALPYHVVHAWPMLHPPGFTEAAAETVVDQLRGAAGGRAGDQRRPRASCGGPGRRTTARPRRRVDPADRDRRPHRRRRRSTSRPTRTTSAPSSSAAPSAGGPSTTSPTGLAAAATSRSPTDDRRSPPCTSSPTAARPDAPVTGRGRLSRAAAEAVEVAEAGGAVDHRAERHPLRRQVQDDQDDEDDRAHRSARLEHDRRARARPPSRLAPVSPSISRSPRSAGSSPAAAPTHRAPAPGRPGTSRPPGRSGT